MKKLIIIYLFFLIVPFGHVAAYETNLDGESYYFFLRGLMSEREGQLPEAIELFEKAVRQDPRRAPLRVELGYAYSLLGKSEEAIQEALEAIKTDEKYLPAYFLLGTIYLQQNNVPEALRYYEKVLQFEPGNENALYILGTLNINIGHMEKGIEYLKQLCKLHPGHPSGCLSLAQAYYILDRFEESLEMYRQVVETDYKNTNAYLGMADIYEKQKNWEKVVSVLQKFLENDSANSDVRYRLAVAYYENKEYQKSTQEFRELAQEEQINVVIPSIFFLGVIEEEQKQYYNAIGYYKKVIKLINRKQSTIIKNGGKLENVLPARGMVYLRLGYIYLNLYHAEGRKQSHLRQAIYYAQQAVENEPQDATLHYFLGILFTERGNHKGAIKAFQRSIFLKTQETVGLAQSKKGPDFDELYFRLGVLFDHLKNFQEMEYHMQQAIHYNEKNAQALNYLGYSYADKNKQLELAEDYIKRALQVEPGNGAFLDSMGWVYYRLGDYEKSLQYLKKALVTLKDDPMVLEHIGDAYLAFGNPREAQKYWQEALQRNPKNSILKKKIKQHNK